MARITAAMIAALDAGRPPAFRLRIHFQQVEEYRGSDYLIDVGSIVSGMSEDGRYEISNTTARLRNTDYYFSRFFARELPNNKRCEIIAEIGGGELTIFAGICASNWTLTPQELTLPINA